MESLYFKSNSTELHHGSALKVLKTFDNEIVDCVVTSPPYWNLRDYGTAEWKGGSKHCDHTINTPDRDSYRIKQNISNRPFRGNRDKCLYCDAIRVDDQIGLENTFEEYVNNLVRIFEEIKRVLKDDGVVWLNLGDTYFHQKPYGNNKLKTKDMIGIPWRVAFALQENGWYLRSDIIWQKKVILPESVKDRCTKSHEYIFMLTKSQNYYFNAEAIKEPTVSQDNYTRDRDNPNNKTNTTPGRARIAGMKHNNYETRNKRSVWTMSPNISKDYHYATFPKEIPMNCIKASCPENGVVLDPFVGSGTTVQVAEILGKKSVGIDINKQYLDICLKKIQQKTIWFH